MAKLAKERKEDVEAKGARVRSRAKVARGPKRERTKGPSNPSTAPNRVLEPHRRRLVAREMGDMGARRIPMPFSSRSFVRRSAILHVALRTS